MKKKIIIIISIIFIIVVGVISYFGYNFYIDNKEKILLQNELDEIAKYVNEDTIDIEKIKQIIKTDITTGNRIPVEDALEKYITDSFEVINNTMLLINDQKLTNILTAANYQNDGPLFSNTLAYIKETKDKLIKNKEEIISLATKSRALEYFSNKTKDDYYEEMYLDLAFGNGLKESDVDSFSESIDSIVMLLDISNEAINFLSQNSSSWQIQDNQIYFTNQDLLNSYNNIISKIK